MKMTSPAAGFSRALTLYPSSRAQCSVLHGALQTRDLATGYTPSIKIPHLRSSTPKLCASGTGVLHRVRDDG